MRAWGGPGLVRLQACKPTRRYPDVRRIMRKVWRFTREWAVLVALLGAVAVTTLWMQWGD